MSRPVIDEILDRLVDVAEADDGVSFVALVRAAGLDPARDFRGASLTNLDFRNEDLRGFDFSSADLTGADFRRANLAKVCFEGAILTGAIGLQKQADVENSTVDPDADYIDFSAVEAKAVMAKYAKKPSSCRCMAESPPQRPSSHCVNRFRQSMCRSAYSFPRASITRSKPSVTA